NRLHAAAVDDGLGGEAALQNGLLTARADDGAIGGAGYRLFAAAVELRAGCGAVGFNDLYAVGHRGADGLTILTHNLRAAVDHVSPLRLATGNNLGAQITDGVIGGQAAF